MKDGLKARARTECITQKLQRETHVVSAHRLEHLLQLNAQLLNVVHQDTRLQRPSDGDPSITPDELS